MLAKVLTILGLLTQLASCDKTDIGLTPDLMIQNHGYVCETHYITTEDGYILPFHRIPHGINDDSDVKRPVALLMHGLTSSSAAFVTTGPSRSLGYILADAGYDVWLANSRGNAFARNHTSLDPVIDGEQFYNFTFHEIGYYDVANSIDYILDVTGEESLFYVGHSQGTTAFLVLASIRPEYNAKIRLASLMAPAGIVKHYPDIFVQDVCKYVDLVQSILKNWKIYEIPYVKELREFVTALCADPSADPLCDLLYQMGYNADGGQVEEEFLPVIYTNNPSNAGMKGYMHFFQQIRDGGFRLFDYGAEKNLQVYGTEEPPPYDLSKISAPVAFYYGKNDGLITVEDAQTLISMVPNVANDYLVPYDLFVHHDFVYARDIIELVYNELMSVMARY